MLVLPKPPLQLPNGKSPSCQVDNFPLQRRYCSAVSIALSRDVIDQIQNGRCLSVYVECGGKTTQLGAVSLHSSCSRSGICHDKVQCLDGRRHDGRCQTFSDKVSPGDEGIFIKLQDGYYRVKVHPRETETLKGLP